MIVPINIPSSSPSNPKLPPSLARISNDEVVLIELQGSLEVEQSHISDRDGKLVGKLKIDASTNVPTLLIGHHLLEGKIASLSKPLAVLRKTTTASATNSSNMAGAVPDAHHAAVAVDNGNGSLTLSKDGEDEEGDDVEMTMDLDLDLDNGSLESQELKRGTTAWDVVAVVKRKIVFAKRPMPIVNLDRQQNT